MSMEEHTDRERSPPPDPAENAAAEIPVPNSPTPTVKDVSRYLQPTSDAYESYRRAGIDAGSVDRSVEKPASEYSPTAELDRWTRSTNFRTDQASFRIGADAD